VLVLSGSTRNLPWREIAIRNHEHYCRRFGYAYQHRTLDGSGMIESVIDAATALLEGCRRRCLANL